MRTLGPIHHVGIACADIEAVHDWVCRTHVVHEDTGIVWDPLQEAHLCLLTTDRGALELVSGRPVASLAKRGPAPYHLCYEVNDIHTVAQALEDSGCRIITPAKPAVLFGGRLCMFLLGPTGLVELLGPS